MAPSYVYGVRFGEHVKIGYTSDPRQRVKTLKSNSGVLFVPPDLDKSDCEPLFAVRGDRHTERLIHLMFLDEVCIGEWYYYRGALRDWLEKIGPDYLWPFRPASRVVSF